MIKKEFMKSEVHSSFHSSLLLDCVLSEMSHTFTYFISLKLLLELSHLQLSIPCRFYSHNFVQISPPSCVV